jgi:hypothetical protein
MNRRLEDLWANAADDGATSPIGVLTGPSESELDDLLAAWFQERSHRIEGGLLLQEARRLLLRFLAEEAGSTAIRQRVERLIQAIRAYQDVDR